MGIHSSGFRDFLLKPELLRAIVDSGFEHPSEGKYISVFLSILSFPISLYNFSCWKIWCKYLSAVFSCPVIFNYVYFVFFPEDRLVYEV